ncbi:hypothetical protein NC652_023883 [Populus alba x Populus x berolinensis]|nr:hypothetical protein NC652_023883 [Populus alba x Populus x berolinensis]
MTPKGFSNKEDDFGAGEACWEMPKTASNASQTMNSTSDPPAVDSSFPKTQLVQSPHLPSSYTGNIAQAAPAPVEVPKYPTDRWGSGTNLPSSSRTNCHKFDKGASVWKSSDSNSISTFGFCLGSQPIRGEAEASCRVFQSRKSKCRYIVNNYTIF